jgi:hypothetical protein
MIIELPIRIKIGNKNFAINLNQYRNWHYRVETNVKKKYKEIIKNKLSVKNKFNKVEVITQLYLKLHNKDGSLSKVRKDKGNVYSIASKYFFDCLVDNNILTDDNDFIIKRETILETIAVKTKEEEKIVFKIKEIE